MSSINNRINKIAIEIFSDNNSRFAKEMDTSEANIRNYRSSVSPKIDFILKLHKKLEINFEWILEGKGEMLNDEPRPRAGSISQVKTEDEPTYTPSKADEEERRLRLKALVQSKASANLIPLYEGEMTAGMAIAADLSPTIEPVEMIDAGDWFRDATAAMRVHGDSMAPEYNSGSIVALREVKNKRLIVYGQDYLIETSEYRILKRIQKSDNQTSWLACSVNQEVWENGSLKGRLIHEPFDVFIDDVSRLFMVLGSVKRNYSSRIVHNNSK